MYQVGFEPTKLAHQILSLTPLANSGTGTQYIYLMFNTFIRASFFVLACQDAQVVSILYIITSLHRLCFLYNV